MYFVLRQCQPPLPALLPLPHYFPSPITPPPPLLPLPITPSPTHMELINAQVFIAVYSKSQRTPVS